MLFIEQTLASRPSIRLITVPATPTGERQGHAMQPIFKNAIKRAVHKSSSRWTASTLLALTALMMVMGLMTQLAHGASHQVYTSESTYPGGQISVAVHDSPELQYSAYLPGLHLRRIVMTFDRKSGFHIGRIHVPATAPNLGYCTVRIITGGEEVYKSRFHCPRPISDKS